MIKKIFPDGLIHEYNSYNDIIKKTYLNRLIKEYQYKYDLNGNKTKIIYSNGDIEEYITNYDDKGRLIQIGDCHIKYLDE